MVNMILCPNCRTIQREGVICPLCSCPVEKHFDFHRDEDRMERARNPKGFPPPPLPPPVLLTAASPQPG